MVLKIFHFGRQEDCADVWSSGYSQRLSRRNQALTGPQPAPLAPACCVVLTQCPEKHRGGLRSNWESSGCCGHREHLKEHSPRDKAATGDRLDPVNKTPTGVGGKPWF